MKESSRYAEERPGVSRKLVPLFAITLMTIGCNGSGTNTGITISEPTTVRRGETISPTITISYDTAKWPAKGAKVNVLFRCDYPGAHIKKSRHQVELDEGGSAEIECTIQTDPTATPGKANLIVIVTPVDDSPPPSSFQCEITIK